MNMERPDAADMTEVRVLHDADTETVRTLFREVFEHEISKELWQWKYRARDGHAVGVFINGEMVGHYGGASATILYKGKPAKALQSVDVMVKRSARHLVRKRSPYFLAGSMILEQFVGYDKPYLLGYGFPNEPSMGISQRLGLFTTIGQLAEVSWQVDPSVEQVSLTSRLFTRSLRITMDNYGTHARSIDKLWQEFSAELQDYVIVQKNAAHLRYRYLLHPVNEYYTVLLSSRLSGKPLGLVVLKKEPERVLLMDLIAPLSNMEAVLQMAMQQTLLLGKNKLVTWCNKIFVERFAVKNAVSQLLPVMTPANTWTPGPAPEELQDRWWLMPGDTDFL